MGEFEAATIAYQQASLAAQQAGWRSAGRG